VEWLCYRDALRLMPVEKLGAIAPQAIAVVANVLELANDIPIPPEIIPTEDGPPCPVRQWVGRIGDRFFTVECEAKVSPHDSALLRTGYLPSQDQRGDWSVLLEFQPLPKSLYIKRPLFIESRNSNPKYVVYRPHPQGWQTTVYKAESAADAESLLAFMKQDAWNDGCFVGEPSPKGNWAMVQGEGHSMGTSPELNDALRFACEWSLRYGTEVLVKDLSGARKEAFVIRQGRVLRPS
jgi:hypothetical protein